jgi:PKD repeat protein
VNSYFWDFGDGNTSSEPNGVHNYSENGSYDVCLTVTNECGENTFCQSIDIDVEALQASGAVSNVNCHGGATGAIQLTVLGGVSPYTIEWSTGDENVLELTGLRAGNYSAVITDADGEQQMVSFEITEPDALVVMDLSISNSSSGEDNGSITFDIDGGTPDYSFEWSNGATTQNLEGLAPGDYSLTVTDANGCVEAFGPFTVGVSSSSSNELIVNKFEIFPNPARDNVTIVVRIPGNVSPIELQIVDAQSRSLWTKVQSPTTVLRQQIPISQLPSGTYFLKVETDGKQVVKPFIKK